MKGNTDLLTDAALNGAESRGAAVEKVKVSKLNIGGCAEFYTCLRAGECSIRDDMDALYDKLLAADAVIVAAPMFFYGPPAQLKAVIDRAQATWVRKHVLKQDIDRGGRAGAFIGVGATSGRRLFEGSQLMMRYFFDAIGVKYGEELLARGVDKKGEIKDHPELLAQAFQLGERLAAPTTSTGGATSA